MLDNTVASKTAFIISPMSEKNKTEVQRYLKVAKPGLCPYLSFADHSSFCSFIPLF